MTPSPDAPGSEPSEEPPRAPREEPDEAVVPTPEEVAAELERAAVVEEPRRYPSTVGGVFYIVILIATGIGIGIVWSGNWRLGVQWMAGALIVAALLRLVLPRRDAGMLAVRHRLFDCVLLGGVGAALIFLAQTIPDQPGF